MCSQQPSLSNETRFPSGTDLSDQACPQSDFALPVADMQANGLRDVLTQSALAVLACFRQDSERLSLQSSYLSEFDALLECSTEDEAYDFLRNLIANNVLSESRPFVKLIDRLHRERAAQPAEPQILEAPQRAAGLASSTGGRHQQQWTPSSVTLSDRGLRRNSPLLCNDNLLMEVSDDDQPGYFSVGHEREEPSSSVEAVMEVISSAPESRMMQSLTQTVAEPITLPVESQRLRTSAIDESTWVPSRRHTLHESPVQPGLPTALASTMAYKIHTPLSNWSARVDSRDIEPRRLDLAVRQVVQDAMVTLQSFEDKQRRRKKKVHFWKMNNTDRRQCTWTKQANKIPDPNDSPEFACSACVSKGRVCIAIEPGATHFILRPLCPGLRHGHDEDCTSLTSYVRWDFP